MPFTKEKFIIKENAALVAWERVTREFLRQLSVRHAHRVSAVMVFEWATGRTVKEHLASGGSTTDLKNINKVLILLRRSVHDLHLRAQGAPRVQGEARLLHQAPPPDDAHPLCGVRRRNVDDMTIGTLLMLTVVGVLVAGSILSLIIALFKND